MTNSFLILSTAVLKMYFAHQFQRMNFMKLITLNLVIEPKALSLHMHWLLAEKFTKISNFVLYVVYGFD
jgi:hypothetical protein